MLRKKHSTLTAIAAIAFFSLNAYAQLPSLANVQKALPEMTGIESVKATPIQGIYEVVSASNVVYVTEDLKYIFSGHILDTEKKTSITEPAIKLLQERDVERQAKAAVAMRDSIKTMLVANQDNFIKEVKGTGKDILYMVTDAECGFCKAMDKNLEQLTDITIYRIPVAFLGPKSEQIANAALCAKDRLETWKNLTTKKVSIDKDAACASPLEANGALMASWKVRSTPTLFRADGERWSEGLISAEITKIFLAQGAYAAAQAKGKNVPSK